MGCDQELVRAVRAIVGRYAAAYAELDRFQREHRDVIPPCDQKTGAIGEFYARLFIEARYPDCRITFGGHSNKSWDLEIEAASGPLHVAVKTTSVYSSRRTLTPIGSDWDLLTVLYLDQSLSPVGLWVVAGRPATSVWPLRSRCCPDPSMPGTGSKDLVFGPNRVAELLAHPALATG